MQKITIYDINNLGLFNDIADKTFDYINCFEGENDGDIYNIAMRGLARQLQVTKISKDYITCDITKGLQENKYMIIKFSEKFGKENYGMNDKIFEEESEDFYTLALDGFFGDFINGNLSPNQYKGVLKFGK